MSQSTKACSMCHEEKPLGEYRIRNHGREKIESYCKDCARKMMHDAQRRLRAGMKLCTKCKEVKPRSEFWRGANGNLTPRCKNCYAEEPCKQWADDWIPMPEILKPQYLKVYK